MAVHHIHPHVMNNGKRKNNNSDDFFNNNDPFGNFFKLFNDGKMNINTNNPNVHTFSSTYTNNNGHVTRHVNNNGKEYSGKDAKKIMDKMKQQSKSIFKHMSNDVLSNHKPKNNLFKRLGNHMKNHKN